MWTRSQSRKAFLALFAIAMFFSTYRGESQANKKPTGKDVCAFVTREMTSALPQVPTLCVPTTSSTNSIELSVFSPTDVLEGKLRRAWSSSLFIVFGDLYFGDTLDRICKGFMSPSTLTDSRLGCVFLVSDSYLSQHGGKQYQVMDPELSGSISNDPIHKDPASDAWYKRWWSHLVAGQRWTQSGTPENAKAISERACKKYIVALRSDPFAKERPEDMPIPDCSVLLTTSFRADIVVSFSNFFSQSLANYERPLAEAFGNTFDDTPYIGEVTFRSPWYSNEGETIRSNWYYDLNDLEFDWEEWHSGVRPEAIYETLSHRTFGQTELHSLSLGSASGIVFKVVSTTEHGRIMDLVNGSQWLISSDTESAKCAIEPGSWVVSIVGGKMMIVNGGCEFRATFISGW